MNPSVGEWQIHDGLMVDICEISNEVDVVVFSTSKLNENSVSPPFPGSDEIEISNAGWTCTESDARVDLNPPSSFIQVTRKYRVLSQVEDTH